MNNKGRKTNTHRHTDTQTHRHTYTHAHTHLRTHAYTHIFAEKNGRGSNALFSNVLLGNMQN